MCGIAGIAYSDASRSVDGQEIVSMLDVMRHRGPDGDGVFCDGQIGLGHVRLSIIDLATGQQPLANEDESIWIVFNGEIYNYRELRSELIDKGHRFKTQSDTEVIVHLYEQEGLACLEKLRGMFAFAIWDRNRRRMIIARDRVGIKPLYYSNDRGVLFFASELKAILQNADVPREIDERAIDTFWTFQYLPGAATLFHGVHKLSPGHVLVWEPGRDLVISQYWDLDFNARQEFSSLESAADSLTELLRESVRLHMISDVPVGFLLSGGMDSSAVLSYAVEETQKEVSTFTIGFDGTNVVDERPFARLVAQKFGTRHYEATISAAQFWDYLPRLLWHLEEPVCEAPAVALHYISEVARQHVKVLLSGEGGDEAFGGYPNYPNMLALERLQSVCGPFRGIAGGVMASLGRVFGHRRLGYYGAILPLKLEDHYWSRVGSPLARHSVDGGQFYTPRLSRQVNRNGAEALMKKLFTKVAGQPTLHQMLYADTKTWLPDDLLVKADKVTMASSLELRVPLLDHKVLEFAAGLAPRFKVQGRETKRVLKTAFGRVLPKEVLERKKAGFPVPYATWLAGELFPKVKELLLDPGAFVLSFFDRKEVECILLTHAREKTMQRSVFALLVLELWHQQFYRKPQPAQAFARC